MKEITQYQICKGMHNEKVSKSAEQHVVQKKFDLLSNTSKMCKTKFYGCPACLILSPTYTYNSTKYENQKSSQLKKVAKKKEAVNLIAAKPKAPLLKTSTERIKLTF